MNQGKGVYGALKNKKLLREQFFLNLNYLLSVSKYKLLTCTLNLEDYMALFKLRVYEYYSQRNESFTIKEIFNTVIYPQCLLQSINLIRTHVSSQMTKIDSINILTEERHSDMKMATMYAEKRLSDVLSTFTPNISKESPDYKAGFEIADLAANAISSSVENIKRKDYEAIQGNIAIYKLIDKRNLDEYIPLKLQTPNNGSVQ